MFNGSFLYSATNMSKFAEKLLILKSVAEVQLERLEYLKRIFTNPKQRPVWATDTQFQKVNAALLRKFPEFDSSIEKTQGFEFFSQKAKIFFDELEPFYMILVDTFDFKEATVAVLGEIGSNTVEMKLDDNPTVTCAFLELFTLYAQTNLLMASIEEKKLIMAVYYKLHFFVKCTNEPNFPRLASYVNNFTDPIKAMQDEFKSLSSSMGKTLVNLMAMYTKLRTVNMLRKEGSLNIFLKPEEMCRPIVDKYHYQIPKSDAIGNWILFGFLLVPETLSLPSAVELCKMALSESFVWPVHRNTVVQLHADYENLFSIYKSKTLNLTKQKKVIQDALKEVLSQAPAKHRARRIFLRQELSSLYRLFSDNPGLLAPKFQVLLCAMALVKEEIFWYFRHLRASLPKGSGKKGTMEEELKDNRICELIFLMERLVSLVKTHKKIIQSYYLEYLRGAHSVRLHEICGNSNFSSSVGNGIAMISNAILEEINGVSPSDFDHNFKALRLNWFRIETSLSSLQSPIPLVRQREAVDRFNLVVQHTRFVDDIDALLMEYASLNELWYWRDLFLESFTTSFREGPVQPLFIMAYLQLLSEFPSNATENIPGEREEIGTQCVHYAETMLGEIVQHVEQLLKRFVKYQSYLDAQLAEINAALIMQTKRKDFKPPKDFVNPVVPGSESFFRNRPNLERIRLLIRNAHQLFSAMNEVESITIYNQSFVPREFLFEKLVALLKALLRSNSTVEITGDDKRIERIIQRPSVLEGFANSVVNVLTSVQRYVDINIDDILRQVFLSECWVSPLGKDNSLDYITAEEADIKFEGSFLSNYVTWYGDFVSKKLLPSSPGVIVYSPARKGFISKSGSAFKAELYCDLNELRSLCTLIGPYGVKMIDREILKFIASNINGVKDHVSQNRQNLDELSKNFYSELACNETLKKMRDVDGFIARVIGIGNALCFRDLLHEALQLVVEERTPYISRVVSNELNQYRINTFLFPEFLPAVSLAVDCGLRVGVADQGLKKSLNRVVGSADAPLLDLLPYMFAASFTASFWRDAQYRAVIEGHTNNVHTLAKSINYMIILFKTITSSNPTEKDMVNQLRIFLEISSILLLRMARTPVKPDKNSPIDFPSIIIFMDKFLQESPLLTRDALEACIPYALLRNEWKAVYSASSKQGKDLKKDISGADVF